MKKLYTLILMAMAAITATAADWTYMPMVREGVEWHYATQNVRQGGTDTGNIYLRFDGSETVDGKTYSVLYRYDTPAFDKAKAQIAAYMREDGHKVYAICKIKPDGTSTSGNESEERVAYDFDTPENNTFAIVGKVDFITVGNTSHKALSDNSVNHIWAIDGIGIAAEGFTADGYLPFPNPYVVASTFYFSTYLVDLKEIATGNTIYSHDSFYGSVADIKADNRPLTVIVAGGRINAVSPRGECSDLTIANTTGATVAHSEGASASIEGLTPGIYVVTATTPEGKRVAKKIAL